jgi:hypothetical protein
VLFLAKCPEAKKLLARIERKHGKAKALSILAHKLGRAVYFMLARKQATPLAPSQQRGSYRTLPVLCPSPEPGAKLAAITP